MMACDRGHIETATVLLQSNADVSFRSKKVRL